MHTLHPLDPLDTILTVLGLVEDSWALFCIVCTEVASTNTMYGINSAVRKNFNAYQDTP